MELIISKYNYWIYIILMMIGLAGLYFELSHPGVIFPGIIGAISLILAFYSFQTLPVNYAGLLLIVLAVIFFIAEIKITSYGILSMGGLISLTLGSIMLFEDAGVSLELMVPTILLVGGFFVFIAALASFLGIGGGFLFVPFLTSIAGLPMFLVAGTSALTVLVGMVVSIFSFMALKGVAVYWPLIGMELFGIFVGSMIGPRTSKYIPDIWLKRIFVILAIYVGIRYTSKGFLGHSIVPPF